MSGIIGKQSKERYYIQKIMPFFVNGEKYYEITFTSVNEQTSKFSRHIAFSKKHIPDFYAVKLSFISGKITLFNQQLPVLIISDWITSIRPCELSNFARIFNLEPNITSNNGYLLLMAKLMELQLPFNDIIFSPAYESIKQSLAKYTNISIFFKALDKAYADHKLEQGSTTNVEPAIGHRFFVRGLIAIGLAAIFIIFYVSLRFSIVSGFTAALTALIALIHDIYNGSHVTGECRQALGDGLFVPNVCKNQPEGR